MVKKTNCTAKGSGYGRAAYAWSEESYKIQGFGTINIQSDSRVFSANEIRNNEHKTAGFYQRAYNYSADAGDEGWGQYTLNKKKAIEQIRDRKTLKVIPITSSAQFERLANTSEFYKQYTCYKQVKGDMEFCSRSLK